MLTHIAVPKIWTGFCVFLLAILSAVFALAQSGNAPQSQTIQMMTVQAKPGMGPEFESVIKSEVIPAVKKAGGMALFTLKTEFGQADTYLLVVPLKSMAELDAPDPLINALGEKGVAYLMVRLNQLTYSPRIFLANMRPDMSIPGPSGYAPKLSVMLKIKVAPNREAEFEKNQKAMQALFGKMDTKGILVVEVGLGGNIDEFISFLSFDSFADIEKFGLALEKLAAEAKLSPAAGVVIEREATVTRFMPELSFIPAAQPAAK